MDDVLPIIRRGTKKSVRHETLFSLFPSWEELYCKWLGTSPCLITKFEVRNRMSERERERMEIVISFERSPLYFLPPIEGSSIIWTGFPFLQLLPFRCPSLTLVRTSPTFSLSLHFKNVVRFLPWFKLFFLPLSTFSLFLEQQCKSCVAKKIESKSILIHSLRLSQPRKFSLKLFV